MSDDSKKFSVSLRVMRDVQLASTSSAKPAKLMEIEKAEEVKKKKKKSFNSITNFQFSHSIHRQRTKLSKRTDWKNELMIVLLHSLWFEMKVFPFC